MPFFLLFENYEAGGVNEGERREECEESHIRLAGRVGNPARSRI